MRTWSIFTGLGIEAELVERRLGLARAPLVPLDCASSRLTRLSDRGAGARCRRRTPRARASPRRPAPPRCAPRRGGPRRGTRRHRAARSRRARAALDRRARGAGRPPAAWCTSRVQLVRGRAGDLDRPRSAAGSRARGGRAVPGRDDPPAVGRRRPPRPVASVTGTPARNVESPPSAASGSAWSSSSTITQRPRPGGLDDDIGRSGAPGGDHRRPVRAARPAPRRARSRARASSCPSPGAPVSTRCLPAVSAAATFAYTLGGSRSPAASAAARIAQVSTKRRSGGRGRHATRAAAR